VKKPDFVNLFQGCTPRGKKAVQNWKDKKRKAASDLTFSLPKSASVIWAVGDAEQQAVILRAHIKGVKAGIDYVERTAAFGRVGRGGYRREKLDLVVAAMHHAVSRLGDPQLHTHCILMNVGVTSYGHTIAVEDKWLYFAKMAAGAVYQATVANELEKAGLRTEAKKTDKGRFLGTFEVTGVPVEVREALSKRSHAIKSATKAKGRSSAAAKEVANLDTRPTNVELPPREEMFTAWKNETARLGFTSQQADTLFKTRRSVEELEVTRKALEAAKRELTDSVSYFTERELFRATLVRTIGEAVEPSFVERAVQFHLDASGDIVHLGGFRAARYYTTREIWETEKVLLDSGRVLAERPWVGLRPKTVERFANKEYRPDPRKPAFTLKPEQKEAVRRLTEPGRDLHILSGWAGTGKTAVLRAVREAYEAEGYRVLGASVAGAAAEQLQKGSGIASDTVAMRFIEMNRPGGLGHSVWHHTKQVLKTSAKKLHRGLNLPVTRLQSPLVIDGRTVLVVDEVGVLGSKDLARLLKAVEEGGGKVILVGDHRQLPPIPAGGGFRSLAERYGFAELEDITRQRSAWGRQKAKDLAEGLAEKVLVEAAEAKRLKVARDREAAVSQLVRDWSVNGVADPKEHMMIATTNADVAALNKLAQEERQRAGLVHGPAVSVGGYSVSEGDRVVFRENNRSLGVKNGTFGTVLAVNGSKLVVRPDGEGPDGRAKLDVMVDARKCRKIELAYSITGFRSQGSTFDESFVLLGGVGTSRQMAYVVGSRERDSIHFYCDRFEAGYVLEQLAAGISVNRPFESPLTRDMEKSVEKRLAHDVKVEREVRLIDAQQAIAHEL
jgi:conjugative relaxase-like TrwC/TraI family protein